VLEISPIFIFPKPIGYSGKEESTYIIIDGLTKRGWLPKIINIPAFDKSKSRNPLYYLKYFMKYLSIIFKSIKISFVKTPKYINLGQSAISLFRDGLIYLIAVNFHGSRYGIINLHGNDFMYWKKSNYKALFFRFIAKSSRIITVLGPNQKKKLLLFGFNPSQIIILDNTCKIKPLSESEINNKHINDSNQLQTLFLGNLIESKGYLVYLDALSLLVDRIKKTDIKILSVIAGNFLKADNYNLKKINEIQTRLDKINNSKQIKVVWKDNVNDRDKIYLFNQSHIFCFPTTYRTEAQPRVLLEAMASGSVIITSNSGEIPYSVPKNCGYLIKEVNPENFSNKLYKTLINVEQRRETAINALKNFNSRYELNHHIEQWENILNQCS